VLTRDNKTVHIFHIKLFIYQIDGNPTLTCKSVFLSIWQVETGILAYSRPIIGGALPQLNYWCVLSRGGSGGIAPMKSFEFNPTLTCKSVFLCIWQAEKGKF